MLKLLLLLNHLQHLFNVFVAVLQQKPLQCFHARRRDASIRRRTVTRRPHFRRGGILPVGRRRCAYAYAVNIVTAIAVPFRTASGVCIAVATTLPERRHHALHAVVGRRRCRWRGRVLTAHSGAMAQYRSLVRRRGILERLQQERIPRGCRPKSAYIIERCIRSATTSSKETAKMRNQARGRLHRRRLLFGNVR